MVHPGSKRLLAAVALGLALAATARAADNRFEKEILAFEARDKEQRPPENAVLFVGSSSIRMWKKLADDFRGTDVINRGFGGAEFSDVMHYLDRVVIPYKPRIVIVYAGSHDLRGPGGSPERVLEVFQQFEKAVHEKLPKTRVCFLSMKPSLAKWDSIELDRKANTLVAEYAAKAELVDYIDIWAPMIAEGSPPPAKLFLRDRNHLSEAGYAIWAKAVRAYLGEREAAP